MYRYGTTTYWHGLSDYVIQKKNWLGIWRTYKIYYDYEDMMKSVKRLIKQGKTVL